MENKCSLLLFILLPCFSFAHTGGDLDRYPDSFEEINWGPELKAKFDQKGSILKRLETNPKYELTKNENIILSDTEVYEDQWDILGWGDNWYDTGARPKYVTASSELKALNTDLTYASANAHDFSFKSVWAEGVSGYGIGEYLTYVFPARHPRITSIIIVNGYVKDAESYQHNSRVKKMVVYKDNIKLAILHLKDIRGTQQFSFEPLGNEGYQESNVDLSDNPDWSLRFEILEVYEGGKYDNTFVSEIYFNGIDVY
jgi:hypothetical protein